MSFIPQTYEEWEHCITVKCSIPLTSQYIAERITALQDKTDYHTQKFIDTWGDAHHQQTLSWFQEAQKRVSA